MTFLGACCRDQQDKNKTISSRVTTRKKHKAFQTLVLSLVLLFVTVFCTVFSTAIAQSQTQNQTVRLELLTISNQRASSTSGTTNPNTLTIGSHVGLRVSSQQNNYVYIYNYDAAGSLNTLSNPADNFMPGGQTRIYPNNHSLYEVSGPGGLESIFAIASQAPLSTARLQQLQAQYIQAHNSRRARAVLNGSNGGSGSMQDGWLADSIIFNVIDPNSYASNTPAPVTQAPALSNYSPSQPVANPAPISSPLVNNPAVSSTVTASNLSGIGQGVRPCTLAGLKLRAPGNSTGFKPRCINQSYDSSFESSATMHDVVVHFGTELVSQGFSYQATTNGEQHDFRATFAYNGTNYLMQVRKTGQYYRFDLNEFNPKAFGN